MYLFWEPIVEPLLDRLQPEVMVEIGSDHGYNTRNLLEFARRQGSTLHVVDPLPKYDVEEWLEQYQETLVFHKFPSLEILDSIPSPDVVFIDGDHNWHTVFNELKLLEKTAESRFPVVLFHDIGWPYARRDLYYEPDRIPTPHRHPYRKQGMRPGVSGLDPTGGLNDHLFNAVNEGGPRNGVLTAVEDFISEASIELEFLAVPGFHDLGILYQSDLPSRSPSVGAFIQDLESPPLDQWLGQLEALRIESVLAHNDTKRDLSDTRSQFTDLMAELQRTRARVQSTEQDRDAKVAQVQALGREIEAAKAETARAGHETAKARVEIAKLHLELERERAELAAWMQQYNSLRSRRSIRLALGAAQFASPIFRILRGSSSQQAQGAGSIGEDDLPAHEEQVIADSFLAGRPQSAEDAVAEIDRLYRSYVSSVEPEVLAELTTADTSASVRVVNRSNGGSRSGALRPRMEAAGSASVVPESTKGWQEIVEEWASWTEDFVVVLEAGDTISDALPNALGHADLSYGDRLPAAYVFDHDWLDDNEERVRPEFKPGFSPDFLLEYDYTSRAVALRRTALTESGLLRDVARSVPEQYVIRDVLLRLWEQNQVIGKIDAVLAHFSHAPGSSFPAIEEDAAYAQTVLTRRDSHGMVSALASGMRVQYPPQGEPLVSIIIPFRDRAVLLEMAVESITRLTTYPRYELVLVNNQSKDEETHALLERLADNPRVRIVDFDEPFNYSLANNQAASQANGEFLVFLNNDVKLISPGWLEELVGFAGQPGVGAVGALLYYGDGSIQHAGVVVGMQGYAGHLFAGENPLFVPQQWIRHVRNVSAVTGACLCVSRSVFEAMGGFDEGFQLTGNDVDFCLRLVKSGRRNVVVPSVELFHYEKQSRGDQEVPKGDKLRSLDKYQPYLRDGDPYWNRNLLRSTSRILPRPWQASEMTAEAAPRPEQGLLRAYDASPHDLELNRALMTSFQENRQVDLGTMAWFLPRFDHVYRGGIHTIMRLADSFSARSGTLNRFYVMGGASSDPSTMGESIREAFPTMKWELAEISTPEEAANLPPSDIGVCTLWTTAYSLLKYNNCRGKFYLVQDFEPAFFPANSVYGLIEQTYRFGFVGLVNTPGVAQMYRSYGNQGEYFVPGVDRTVFNPNEAKNSEPIRIVFYGRPSNPRNGFELGVEALTQIKDKYGDRVQIVSAGADFDEADLGLDGVIDNLGILPSIDAVADLYRNSDIGLVFMFTKHPSYQPLEYMASGCATVTNFNEANLWLLRDEENSLLSEPTVSCVVDALTRLIEDDALRARVAQGGLQTTAALDWDEELDRVFRYVTTGLGRDD